MTGDETVFLHNLYRLGKQGALGVGMDRPLPHVVDTLVASGYCSVTDILNPHELPDRPGVFVQLTPSARELLDLQSGTDPVNAVSQAS